MPNEKNRYLKAQDILVLTKLLALENKTWTQTSLARDLLISQSEISESLLRSNWAGLYSSRSKKVNKLALEEFLLHGIKYVFAVKPSITTRGVGTAHSADSLKHLFLAENSYVWAYSKGTLRGEAIEPLYKSVPEAVQKDPKLYKYLALIDLLRVGKAREVEFAISEFKEIFKHA